MRKDGSRFWASMSLTRLDDEEGKAIGFIKVLHDLTDKKNAEAELKKSEEDLRRAEEIAHMGRWEWDVVKNQVHWSKEVTRIFELPESQVPSTLKLASR